MLSRGEFYELVCVLCDRHGASVTSAKRSVKRNHDVGGATNSWHLLGYAADVVLDVATAANAKAFVRDATRLELQAIEEGDHIHVEVK